MKEQRNKDDNKKASAARICRLFSFIVLIDELQLILSVNGWREGVGARMVGAERDASIGITTPRMMLLLLHFAFHR